MQLLEAQHSSAGLVTFRLTAVENKGQGTRPYCVRNLGSHGEWIPSALSDLHSNDGPKEHTYAYTCGRTDDEFTAITTFSAQHSQRILIDRVEARQ